MKTNFTLRSFLVSILSLTLLASGAAKAATIYQEVFVSGGGDVAINAFGWSAYRNNGTDYSAGPLTGAGLVLVVVNTTNAFIASSTTQLSTHFALLSDAGSIDPTAYQNDLTISFRENASDDAISPDAPSPEMGWRALARVGSTIYASDFISFSASATTHNLTVSNSIWHVWTDETDLSNGFNIATIPVTSGVNLAAGSISGFGILAIDGADNNDRMRLYNFSISGTAIPEPKAVLLGSIGVLLLLRRRR